MGSEKEVESSEGASGENNESSEVTTWSKLNDVKSINVASVNTWKVSGSSLNLGGIISVDHEWSLLQDVSRVSVFSLTISESS